MKIKVKRHTQLQNCRHLCNKKRTPMTKKDAAGKLASVVLQEKKGQ